MCESDCFDVHEVKACILPPLFFWSREIIIKLFNYSTMTLFLVLKPYPSMSGSKTLSAQVNLVKF